jgi:hypothetical protein
MEFIQHVYIFKAGRRGAISCKQEMTSPSLLLEQLGSVRKKREEKREAISCKQETIDVFLRGLEVPEAD